jgi:hypothetical protein
MAADVGMQADASAFGRWAGRVPILIGACGHRNIANSDELTGAVKTQCEALKKSYPHSPFVILSALAEGADRLIAKVAMKALGAELIAVLPMPPEEYERDFQTAESRDEFRALLKSALYVRVADAPPGDAWKVEGEPRNIQYARAGAIIADHAQVLFAIWDGKPARGTGGTADQVVWFERGYSPNAYTLYKNQVTPLDPLEPGRSIRIDPASAKVEIVENPGAFARVKKSAKGQKSKIESILQRTDEFNGKVARNPEAVAAGYPLVDEVSVGKLALTNAVYHAADGVSAAFAKVVRKTDTYVYCLALLAVIVFNFVSSWQGASWVYLVITALMVLFSVRVLFGAKDNRFLEYRCLAEAMRTLFFWRMAGVKRSVWLPFLARQSGAVHWIRHAVRTVEFCQDCLPSSGQSQSDGLRLAKERWIDDQAGWLAGKEEFHFRRHRLWSRLGRIAIAGSFAIAGLIAALTLMPGPGNQTLFKAYVTPETLTDYWQLALSLCAGGAVAARGFLLRTAHLEIAKQYASQRLIFENASLMLDLVKSATAPEWTSTEILEKLGQEALQEQAEWVWLRHTRPFEVPA